MRFPHRLVARLALLTTVTTASLSAARPAAPAAAPRGEAPEAALRPEVRLRKLHLVRPDLIPYPIAYEVYC
ncbi:MAG TPA: hypothetical protein VK324_15630 [Tepidisphaeraceae bacterium]|nr:hypothetical protein [Tepidisphaeraceae bacterium]